MRAFVIRLAFACVEDRGQSMGQESIRVSVVAGGQKNEYLRFVRSIFECLSQEGQEYSAVHAESEKK